MHHMEITKKLTERTAKAIAHYWQTPSMWKRKQENNL
jgi:hypothetical protein